MHQSSYIKPKRITRHAPTTVGAWCRNYVAIVVLSLLSSGCSTIEYGTWDQFSRSEKTLTATTENNHDKTKDAADVQLIQDPFTDIAKCAKSHGTLALIENMNSQDPTASMIASNSILRALVGRSGCFKIVDRGQVSAAIENEAKASGKSAFGSLEPVDYYLTPQLIYQDVINNDLNLNVSALSLFSNNHLSGSSYSSVSKNTTYIGVVLILTNAKTGAQVVAELGNAKKTDVMISTFNGGGNYSNAPNGASAAAFYDAYNRMAKNIDSIFK